MVDRLSWGMRLRYLIVVVLGVAAGLLVKAEIAPSIPDFDARVSIPGARANVALQLLNDQLAQGSDVVWLVCASWDCAAAPGDEAIGQEFEAEVSP